HDDVVIPDLAGTPAVTYSTGTTSVHSLTNSEVLNLNGGTLDIANPSTIGNALNLSGATMQGAGDVTITGTMNWAYRTLAGSGTTRTSRAAPAAVTGNSNTATISGRTVVNDGTFSIEQSSVGITMASSGVFRNRNGGVFDLKKDVGFLGGAAGSFENQS